MLEPALAHDADDIGDRERFLLIVRHQQRGRVQLLQHRPHFGAEPLTQLDVEARERLIQQHELGLWRERTRERNALLLPAGQLMRKVRCDTRSRPTVGEHLLARLRRAARGRRRCRPNADVVAAPSDAETARSPETPCRSAGSRAARRTPAATARDHAHESSPRSTGSKPAMHRSAVVLPQPLGPSRQPIDPCGKPQRQAIDRAHAWPKLPRHVLQLKPHGAPRRVSSAAGMSPTSTMATAGKRRALPLAFGGHLEHANRERVPAERPR